VAFGHRVVCARARSSVARFLFARKFLCRCFLDNKKTSLFLGAKRYDKTIELARARVNMSTIAPNAALRACSRQQQQQQQQSRRAFLSSSGKNGLTMRTDAHPPPRRHRAMSLTTRAKGEKESGGNIFDKIADEANKMLDVMEGGPKLRKWYGEDSSVGKDGEVKREREEKEESLRKEEQMKMEAEEKDAYDEGEMSASPKRAIYVLDSGSKLGDAVVMQLVLAKLDVKVACENVEAESARYGPYVDVADLGDVKALRRSLSGVRSVIVPSGKFDESFAKLCKESGVKHIVLLSTAQSCRGNVLSMILDDEGTRARKEEKREQLAKSLGIPLTIIRPVNVVDEPTRGKAMAFSKEDGRLSGTISIEDVAVCAVRALAQPPKKGADAIAFEIATSNETGKTDWKAQFTMLKA